MTLTKRMGALEVKPHVKEKVFAQFLAKTADTGAVCFVVWLANMGAVIEPGKAARDRVEAWYEEDLKDIQQQENARENFLFDSYLWAIFMDLPSYFYCEDAETKLLESTREGLSEWIEPDSLTPEICRALGQAYDHVDETKFDLEQTLDQLEAALVKAGARKKADVTQQ